MNNRRILAAALSALLILPLCSCGRGGKNPSDATSAFPADTTSSSYTEYSVSSESTSAQSSSDTGTVPADTSSEATTEPTAPEETTSAPVPTALNYLTGLPLSGDDDGTRRPTLIVINNIKISLPQAGLSEADIIFEVEAEANITRLLAVYYNPEKAPKIGTVRSTRPVIVNIALGLDAVMFHAGGSPQAFTDISTYNCTSINAPYYGSTFYYDQDRVKTKGMEHSLYTTGAKLAARWNALRAAGVRTTLQSGYGKVFTFADTGYLPVGIAAKKVQTVYGSANPYAPFFSYNDKTGMYDRYEYGYYHIDDNTGAQLSFKNVIVLSVTSKQIDSAGRRQFDDVGSGTGYYISNGTAAEIRWSKTAATAPLTLTNLDGSKLEINCGKTFISYVNGTSKIKISG